MKGNIPAITIKMALHHKLGMTKLFYNKPIEVWLAAPWE